MDNDKLRALAAKWRKNPGNVHMQVVQIAREQCADELEALLASEKRPAAIDETRQAVVQREADRYYRGAVWPPRWQRGNVSKPKKPRPSVWVVECDNGSGWQPYDVFVTRKEAEAKAQREDDGSGRVLWRVERYDSGARMLEEALDAIPGMEAMQNNNPNEREFGRLQGWNCAISDSRRAIRAKMNTLLAARAKEPAK